MFKTSINKNKRFGFDGFEFKPFINFKRNLIFRY